MNADNEGKPCMEIPQFKWATIQPQGNNTQNGTAIKPFGISTHLVTNEQYEYFVMDGGYKNNTYWLNENNEEDGPKPDFSRSQWPQPNRPKTNVSWVEARAFCRWFSEKTGTSIQLPHEDQWEIAAAGELKPNCDQKDDVYPWNWGVLVTEFLDKNDNNNLISHYANVNKNLGQTSTVGLYKKGQTNSNIMDMAGNVWEWCNNSVNENNPELVALRGGSWGDSPEFARARVRFNLLRDLRSFIVGFRVCRLP